MGNYRPERLSGSFVAITSNSESILHQQFGKTQETTAVIQYILTSAQSFGSQYYYNKSLMTILGLAGILFCKMGRHGQNELSFVPKKILTWVLREARGGLKAIAGKRQ